MKKVILSVLVIFALSGWGIKRPISKDKLSGIGKISVVSLLGTIFDYPQLDLFFQNEFSVDNVKD